MKKLYQTLFLTVLLSIIFGFNGLRVLAVEEIHFDDFRNIDVDKVWSVTFSKEVDPETIHWIGVGLNGKYLDTIEHEISEDGKTVYVRNTEPYKYNSHYVLDVNNRIKSIDGEQLGEYIYITFSTKTVDFSDIEREWKSFDTGDDFLFYFDVDSLKDGYDYVYRDAEIIMDSIEEYLDFDLTQKMTVYIDTLNNRQAYYSAYDHEAFINPHQLPMEDIRYHLAHETIHAVTDKKWGIGNLAIEYDDIWIIEGIAEYVSKHHVYFPSCHGCGNMKELGYGKDWYINKFNYYGMDVVRSVNTFVDLDRTVNKYGDYLALESMVYFLVEEYGKDIFFEDFTSNRIRYGNTPEAIEKTYGKPQEEIINEWKEYFNI